MQSQLKCFHKFLYLAPVIRNLYSSSVWMEDMHRPEECQENGGDRYGLQGGFLKVSLVG